MLHGTIRNDDFWHNTALQCWNNVVTDVKYMKFTAMIILHSQRCNYSKQCRNNVTTLCCAKNRPYESFCVTSPLCTFYTGYLCIYLLYIFNLSNMFIIIIIFFISKCLSELILIRN